MDERIVMGTKRNGRYKKVYEERNKTQALFIDCKWEKNRKETSS